MREIITHIESLTVLGLFIQEVVSRRTGAGTPRSLRGGGRRRRGARAGGEEGRH